MTVTFAPTLVPRPRTSRRWIAIISVLAHAAVATGLYVSGVWSLARVEGSHARAHGVLMWSDDDEEGGGEAAPPAKQEAPKPKAKARPEKVTDEVVQPVPPKDEPPAPEVAPAVATTGDGTGEGTGEGTGSGTGSGPGVGPGTGGGSGGDCTENCEVPKPEAPPTTPTIVPPSVLTGLRLSGETQIVPPDPVKTTMLRDGTTRTTGSFKVCLDAAGRISSITIASSTKYADYDAKIVSAIRAWRYAPYRVNGTPAPACAMVTFLYTIR